MILTPVDKLPATGREKPGPYKKKHNLQLILDDFATGSDHLVMVNYTKNDYSNINSAYVAFSSAIKRSKHPIMAVQRGDYIYLVKKKYLKGATSL